MEILPVLNAIGWVMNDPSGYEAPSPNHRYFCLKTYTAKVAVWGNGPPLVLLPGIAGGHELLNPLIQILAKKHQVFTFNYRGEESLFSFRSKGTLDDLVIDLDELLLALGLENPTIAGVSFGATVALQFARRFPTKVSALILQGTGARFERGILHRLASLILSHYQLPQKNPLVNQFFRLFLGGNKGTHQWVEKIAAQCWKTDQSIIAQRLQLIKKFHFQNPCQKIRVPCLMMHGENDILVSMGNFKELAQSIPGSEVHYLRGMGHMAFLQAPEIMGEIINNFLKEVYLCTDLLAS